MEFMPPLISTRSRHLPVVVINAVLARFLFQTDRLKRAVACRFHARYVPRILQGQLGIDNSPA